MLRIVHWTTIFYVVILTLLLELPNPAPVIDPIAGPLSGHKHLVAFTILGFLVELGRCKKTMLFWLGVLVLYAIGTEVLQGLLHSICNRYFGWLDIVHNIVGLLLGTFIGYFCRPLVKRPTDVSEK